MMNRSTRYNIQFCLLLLSLILSAVASDRTTEFDRNAPVAIVNGEPILAEEFHMVLDRHRTRSTGNALDISLQESIKIKLQQSLAVQLGLLDDNSYDGFLEDLKEENKRREALKADGGIVYGPVRLTERMYYQHRMNQLFLALKDDFAHRSARPTEIELRNLYESIKHDLFRKHDHLLLKSYTLVARAAANYVRIFEAIQNGIPVEHILRDFGDDVRSDDIELHHGNAASYEKHDEDFYYQVADMQSGQYLTIPDAADPIIVYCTERIPQGYQLFHEVRDIVYSRWVEREYEAMIEGLTGTAQVIVNEEALSQALTWVD
ncbi:hypothetical protein ACFL45_09705 [Candidatus Neomarinimicrobiota bacterium]